MVLIIPSITIVHGVCCGQIAALAHETHHAGSKIYSQDPIDRARLLRKENAKLIHLHFTDGDAWNARNVDLLCRMRAAVDIPFELSLNELPTDDTCLSDLLDCGIYRLFLPLETAESILFRHCDRLKSRKIVPTVDLSFDFAGKLPFYRQHGIERVAVDISPRDTLEQNVIDWDKLAEVSTIAAEAKIRLTALHGVRGYPELRKLQDLNPSLDSLVLSRALNENRFPCQLIWREVEAEAAFESSPGSNLWSNPLNGRESV